MKNGLHKEYYQDGKIKYDKYYFENQYHRIDGPAIVKYDPNGRIIHQCYCINNKLHREDGPAVISYTLLSDIRIIRKKYFINGREYKDKYYKYKYNLTERMIKANKDINILKIMKIICIENEDKYLIDLIDSKITMIKIAD